MHTAVLALGLLLILSELGAIGFMVVNAINHVAHPQAAVSLVPKEKAKPTMTVMMVENHRVKTRLIVDPATEKPAKKPQMGYFSLVP